MEILKQCMFLENEKVKTLITLLKNTHQSLNEVDVNYIKVLQIRRDVKKLSSKLDELINKYQKKSNLNLIIKNLPRISELKYTQEYEKISNENVRDTMKEYGKVINEFICNNIAYVQFADVSDAKKTQKSINNQMMGTHILKVHCI